jgi:hypothetical protein
MTLQPPANPDVRRQLKDRLLNLSPRAFELFAGDLLEYIGLENVAVTRYIGDGGVDAHGDLIASSSLVRVPTGVQVKRHRANVRRPDIDQFIGALGGRFHHGIIITTADYAPQAREKAKASPVVRIDTVNGDQVAALMARHALGIQSLSDSISIDEDYFLVFEAQALATPVVVREQNATYEPSAEDDLISLRALSYALHTDMQTIRRGWIETEKLQPDSIQHIGSREIYFFRRSRIDEIRRHFHLDQAPTSGTEWRQGFLVYARSRNLTKSYKPVLLKALLKLVNRNGEVDIAELAAEFRAFYIQRQLDGQPVEFGVPLLTNPALVSLDAITRLIVKYPLERFVIKGFLQYSVSDGMIRFAPQLWNELRLYEILDIQQTTDEQLRYYYDRPR